MERANAASKSRSKSKTPEQSNKNRVAESEGEAEPIAASEAVEVETANWDLDQAGAAHTITFDEAVSAARNRRYSPEVVGRLTYALAVQVSPEVAIAFTGHVIGVWKRSDR